MALMNYTAVLPLAGVLTTTTGKAALKSDGTEALAIMTVGATASGVVADAYTPAAPGTATATNGILLAGVYNTTLPTFTNTQQGALQADVSGNLRVRMLGVSGTASDGTSNTLAFATPSTTVSTAALFGVAGYQFNGTTWDRVKKPNAVGRLVSAAGTTNATSVKASAGDLFEVIGYNAAASVRYLKLYNKASAPTVGSDTPVMTIALKPSDAFKVDLPQPLYFSTGIAYALTTGSADADTGALTAADVVGLNIVYQ